MVLGSFEVIYDFIGLFGIGKIKFFQRLIINLMQFGGKCLIFAITCFFKLGLNAPVLLGFEFFNFPLPFGNQAQGHGLDAAGREPSPHFFPQEGGKFIPDQPIEHAPGLLGVYQVSINLTRILQGLFYGSFGYFVKDYSPGFFVR